MFTIPGDTALTLIPYSARYAAAVTVIVTTPAFAIAYEGEDVIPPEAEIEAILIITPAFCFIICFAASCIMK